MKEQQAPARASDLIWREMEDGTVVVSPDQGQVRVLNDVASEIWHLVNGKNTVSEIAKEIELKYDVSGDQAAIDVEQFLQSLEDRGLIIWIGSEESEE